MIDSILMTITKISNQGLGKHAIYFGRADGTGKFSGSLHRVIGWIQIASVFAQVSRTFSLGRRCVTPRQRLDFHVPNDDYLVDDSCFPLQAKVQQMK
jgi:hypothetical protein